MLAMSSILFYKRKDIWVTMTINSLNYNTTRNLVEEWKGKMNKIGFQFHTPFTKN
jgi:Fe-coproporphyrin III synthase